jgi:hypothetical protein
MKRYIDRRVWVSQLEIVHRVLIVVMCRAIMRKNGLGFDKKQYGYSWAV